ncbi:SDR family oxidoreductase [Dactylosporangium sp. NBC_01737]|uniref:SDR family NAD(P)-dependent oxidoreductase n=1 Tax=Dactylosporangium sp. NBC_01737 TaxID=2975959 RepID=UPI002E12887F|nr:SDR family oxidoreductase [Dactylosporangium sp. NBC_01737]
MTLLDGRRILVTGGSRGIGRAIVEGATAAGARCAVICRDPAGAAELLRACADAGSPVPSVHAGDITDADGCEQAVIAAAETLGGVDVVVNNAARVSGGVPDGLFTTTDALLRADFDEKVVGYLRVVRAAVPYLRNSVQGRVVNIGGEAARIARHNVSSGVRNAALVHLTHSMARELGPDGITANVVQPGLVLTAGVRAMLVAGAPDPDAHLRKLAARQSLRRFVEPAEVAAVVVFLASVASSGLTGQVLTVSGGTSTAVHY